jgi:hypothetical protein
LSLVVLAVPAFALGGCGGFSRAVGMSKVSPNEFEVVTKAPLVIPPDFSLRPPAPGAEAEPQSEAEMIAQRAIMGEAQAFTPGMSTGERAIVAAAGGTHADPLIRQIIDQEYANLIRRGDDFADRMIFWGKAKGAVDRGLDAAAEAQRLEQTKGKPADQVEGQDPATIQKNSGGVF